MAAVSEVTVRCSFCGKPNTEVSKVIEGPGVYICNQCVQTCNIVLDDEQSARTGPRIPTWETMSDEQILGHLPRIAAVGDQVAVSMHRWVSAARERGVTWTRIGGALGMTRQSAWERFSGEE